MVAGGFEGCAPAWAGGSIFFQAEDGIRDADVTVVQTCALPISGMAWTIEAIPAYNIKRAPSPGKLFHEKGRGNGYVLTYGGKRFYFSGDSEGVPEMRALKNIDRKSVVLGKERR